MLIRTQRLSDDLLLGLWRLPADTPRGAKRQQERAAAHSLLAAMLGRPVAILHDADGAPRVEGHQISISHTRGFLAILLSRSRRVGVDIEYRSDRIRRIVVQNGLLDVRKLKNFEKKMTREQLDVWNKNRVFLPALGRDDFEKYVSAVVGRCPRS